MTSAPELPTSVLNRRTRGAVLVLVLVCALEIVTALSARAQMFSVIYNFTGGQDGANPQAGVTLNQAGNLYGTTARGGSLSGDCTARGFGTYGDGCGTVFELKRENSGWLFNPLYIFHFDDGALPLARVVFGPDGLLYGTTSMGGNVNRNCDEVPATGCGVAFRLQPPATVCKSALCSWDEAVLWKFEGGIDGQFPSRGDLTFDSSGNIYVAAIIGDLELSPSDNGWTLHTLYPFSGPPTDEFYDQFPVGGLILDPAGNLYSVGQSGGAYGGGGVYELTPSYPYWTFIDVHDNVGGTDGGVMFDSAGNLYGTTGSGGDYGGGTAYELSPSDGGWTFATLYNFSGSFGSYAVMTMDAAGNLYGTTVGDGAYGQDNVFELTPSNGQWIYRSLHDFTGGSDGGQPYGQVTLDANGNLYGTASMGGANNAGVVWEITP